MSTIFTFLCGALFLAGVLLLKDRAMKGPVWRKIVSWALYVIWAAETALGISFIYINVSGGHTKASSLSAVLVLGGSIVLAVILARLLGFFGNKGNAQEMTADK